MIDSYDQHRSHPATAGPVPAERMIDSYDQHRSHPATAGPVPAERMIDSYDQHRSHPATAGPVPAERMTDSNDQHRSHPATAGPVPAERMIDSYGFATGTGPVEQPELRSHGTKTTSGSPPIRRQSIEFCAVQPAAIVLTKECYHGDEPLFWRRTAPPRPKIGRIGPSPARAPPSGRSRR